MDYYTNNFDYVLAGTVLTVIGVCLLIFSFVALFMIIVNWRLYKKAGREGWTSIIPIYNLIVKFEFLDIPLWFIILAFIPAANIAVIIITSLSMARKFNKDMGFAVGLMLLPIIFVPILAFGNSEYNENAAGLFESEMNKKSNCKYCTECGKEVHGKYCSNCGKEV